MLLIAPSSSAVEIHAHRGGPNIDGVAAFPENSMSGFEHSLAQQWVIEFDLQVTSDGVAVVMHDEDLDRTTDCAGPVDEHTLADLDACRIDQLGIQAAATPLDPGDPRLEPIPTLDQVIALLEETGGKANIEVKDLAGDHPGFVPATYSRLQSSGLSSSRVILQSFKPNDLQDAKPLYPGVATSLLSLGFLNDVFLGTATEMGVDWVSPQWPISAEYVTRAWEAGRKIVPYTVDDAAGIEAAGALRVDALITNDPTLADRLVGHLPVGPEPVEPPPVLPPPVEPEPSLSLKLSGKTRVRAGRTVRIVARVRNSGEAGSDPATLRIRPGRSGLNPRGGKAIRIPKIAAGATRRVRVTLAAQPRRRNFGRFPVKFSLAQDGFPVIRKTRRILVQRPAR